MARLGRYEIVRQLAKGALTDLLLGKTSGMEGFQRYVAIKRLREDFARDKKCLDAFVNEARLAARLHHHNIVQVHDIDQEGGQPYFAMEFVHGVDLRTLLGRLTQRNERLPLQHVVQIIAAAAAALHHAHEQRGPDGEPLNIVHRDVTPANILIGYDGNVKVVDFGIAKAAINRIQTDQGVLKGSVPYMAPEQCAGKQIDRRCDIFALGVVLYELATVRRLFKGPTEFLTMSAIINAAVPKPSQYRQDIPKALEAIMLKALGREPADRYQSAGEMSLALDQVASTVGVGASTTALANYMRLQFGDQKEPWLVKNALDENTETTLVDFDGGASGLAPPPSEAVEKNALPRVLAASKSSPIVQARVHALTPVESRTSPKLPPPLSKKSTNRNLLRKTDPEPEPVDPGTLVPEITRLTTDEEVAPTDRMVRTKLRAPPPPPPTGESPLGAKAIRDATEIVAPLTARSYPVLERPRSRLKWLVLGALVVGGVAGVIVLWPFQDALGPESTPATATPATEPAATPQSPAVEESKPAMQMTMRDYERAQEEKAAQAEAAKAAAKEAKPADAKHDAAATTSAETAKPVATAKPTSAEIAKPVTSKPMSAATAKPADAAKPKTAVAKAAIAKATTTTAKTRTVAKPTPTKRVEAKKPAPTKKPAAGKKWNPDDLFLEEK